MARGKFLAFVERLARQKKSPVLVLVTHHVEEITPAFTHTLLLRSGRVVAAGPRCAVLKSANLSATFGASLQFTRRNGRLGLNLTKS